MVKNREELIQVARENANQLKNHLRKAIRGFLKMQGVTPEELSYVLGIDVHELMVLLEGDGNVTVDVLSKLLVATDMAVEIKPIGMTPLGGYGKGMPKCGGFPPHMHIPTGPDGQPLPPPPGFFEDLERFDDEEDEKVEDDAENDEPVIPQRLIRKREDRASNFTPKRDAHGRFAKRDTKREPIEANPYINLTDRDLANIIRRNIWDGEIDLGHSTHKQLADFVFEKEKIMRNRATAASNPDTEMEQPEPEQPQGNVRGGGTALSNFLEMLGNIAREAEHDPHLAETISRFMPK